MRGQIGRSGDLPRNLGYRLRDFQL
jgi:hypothetical protein